MRFTRFFFVTFFASLALTTASAQPAATQTPAPTQAEQEAAQAARAELVARALKLLDEAAGEAASLRLAENRARLQSAAAGALWPHDEARAREIFQSALSGISALASALAPDDARFQQHYHQLQSLRREIAFAVAQRDPKLALDFVRGSRLPQPPQWGERGNYRPDMELALEAQLAEMLAARDPREAVRLAEESLARGVSGQLSSVLERLRQSDPQAASRLAADVVRKLRTTNLSTNYEAAGVAGYLIHASRAPDTQQPNSGPNISLRSNAPVIADAGIGPRPLVLDDAVRRELISTMVNAALNTPDESRGRGRGGNQLLPVLQSVLPEVERLMPAQAAALRRRLSEAGGPTVRPEGRGRWQEYEQLMQTGTADAIAQAAQRAPAEMRGQLYRRAAFKALEDGSADRARQIVNDSVTNPQQREQILREIDSQLFWRVAEQGDAQQALALLARVKSPEERMGMLLGLAQSAAGRGNRELAERLLEEVLSQTAGRARNMSQFSTQLQAANAYARFAPERAFAIAESGVEHLNELMAAAVLVDGFGQESFDQGELKLEGNVWSMLVQQTGELLAALAPKDFERARDAAARFQRPEARTQALLAVARGALGGDGNNNMNRGPGRRPMRPQPIAPLVRRP